MVVGAAVGVGTVAVAGGVCEAEVDALVVVTWFEADGLVVLAFGLALW